MVRPVEPRRHCPADRVVQRLPGRREKLEPRALARRLVVVLDRVVEAARCADDRERAVLHRVHLVEPARLVQRRHQEEVAARFNDVAQLRREPDVGADAAGVLGGQPVEEILGRGIAGPEHRHLHDHRVQRPRQGLLDQVEALLVREARHDPEHGPVLALLKPEPLLQVRLARRLAAHVPRRVLVGDHPVRLRIPVLVVAAVQDADEVRLAVVQVRRHPLPAQRLQDLLRVRRGHRGDRVREPEARLQQVDLAVVLENIRRVVLPSDADVGKRADVVLALVADVVDRQHACGVRQRRKNAIPRFQEHGNERRHPVVRVHDVGSEVLVLADLKGGLGQKRVPECVVVVLAPRLVVDAGAAEVALAIHKPDRHLLVEHSLEDPDPLLLASAHVDACGLHELDPVFLAVDGGVKRHDDPRVVPQLAQRLGQGRNDVAQPADLRVGRALGRNEQDLQAAGRGRGGRRRLAFPVLAFG